MDSTRTRGNFQNGFELWKIKLKLSSEQKSNFRSFLFISSAKTIGAPYSIDNVNYLLNKIVS